MTNILSILPVDPNDKKALGITEELSADLFKRFGSDGKNSFTDWQNNNPKFLFVVASLNNEIVGCGAFRAINENTAEIKRMYAKFPRRKIGQTILSYLEEKAKDIGFRNLVLETRLKNNEAVQFYQKQGYKVIPNYGKYVNRSEAVCFGKSLI
ncbi:N-acetyltransferase [Flavobacterium cheongpyeongense]|jgi:GNAT superfamily N-acetyltransferase|uniref:N-acetyltransferase n=1 Tax=Flavobacterium cheongpyeongense TaxID=2212651 RepID=A0A2V4C0S1_9FLAO|nr:GNAT family N-acetyltransferase [Flavobacterium cheongpyeongense]PXY39854.1 N-acetyltransferase [Flavobacterium cheongpyeongense]